jgi:hypothetical protein
LDSWVICMETTYLGFPAVHHTHNQIVLQCGLFFQPTYPIWLPMLPLQWYHPNLYFFAPFLRPFCISVSNFK